MYNTHFLSKKVQEYKTFANKINRLITCSEKNYYNKKFDVAKNEKG